QITHDVCIQNLPVTFAIDRAGLVGSDGETHQGIFDLSYLSSIPNMHIMAPKNKWELSDMLKFAIAFDGPTAIRYPRGEAYDGLKEYRAPVELGKGEWICKESGIALLAVGSMVETAVAVREQLKELGFAVSLINARFVKPIDTQLLAQIAEGHDLLVTMEENVLSGGFGQQVLAHVSGKKLPISVLPIALPDQYVEHGNVTLLKKEVGIDADSIVKKILQETENNGQNR
ncbi:MAG: 1-deoxy-D-xylulose-5-phosphate synthase, partial [Lachnospiraceae bacterium]|nr:1-deoxy-D-xylulose-5-phosphate synthase [Lachnospiraceae bacterium]